jgi:GDP-4-dehydro-6-deoxy-D-mannose reductase
MNHRILITGIHGFCAGHLVRRLIAEGLNQIYATDIRPEPPAMPNLHDYISLDLTDKSKVNEMVQSVKPGMIFHLAGITGGEASEIYHVNFLSTIYLLEAIRQWVPQAKILLVGSAAEYGDVPVSEMPIGETHLCNPATPYGISKYAATLAATSYAKEHGIKIVTARPFNIVGAGVPAGLVVGAVLLRIKKALAEGNEPYVIRVGNLDTERDFIAVQDVADAYCALLRSNSWGEVFNVCSGRPVSMRAMLRSLVKKSKQKIEFQVDPALVRTTDVNCVYGNREKARQILGFDPKIPLDEALNAAWDAVIGESS